MQRSQSAPLAVSYSWPCASALELQDGETALHEAACRGEKDVAALLLDRGAAVDATDDVSGIPCVCTGQAGCALKGGWLAALFEADAA